MHEPKVFVNFRNGDGEQATARLCAPPTACLDESEIFRSCESIDPGENYIEPLRGGPVQHINAEQSVISTPQGSKVDIGHFVFGSPCPREGDRP